MKNIIALLIFSFLSLTVSAQYGVQNLLRKYKNDSGIIAWQFEGDISGLLSRGDGNDLKSSIESVDFYMFSDGKDIDKDDQEKLKKKIASDNYELLVQARDQGKKIKILGIEENDVIKKVFAQVKSEEMNGYFFLTGEIYLEDLQDLDLDNMMKGISF